MRPALTFCLGVGALAGLPAVSEGPGESQAQAEIAGHWVFESWTGEACRFGGTAFLSKTEAPQTYDCELTARQSCQGFIWVVRQSCVAERAGDQLTITSRIEEFLEGEPTPNYWPDNFELTIESGTRMTGDLISHGVYASEFARPAEGIS